MVENSTVEYKSLKKILDIHSKLKSEGSIGRMGPVKSLGGKRSEGQNHHKLGFDLTDKSHPNKKKLLNILKN